MDEDFSIDRPELNGALISMEFGPGGRIQRLWASDPNLPEEGEEFQFVLSPVNFGEEFAEDYYPGTILIGARTSPTEPWVLSRNVHASHLGDEDDPSIIEFDYDFALLPEIQASGKFYETMGPVPLIKWDVTISNRSKKSIEIGELGFPFALNNLYEGFGRGEKTGKNLWSERVYVHKYIGGSASYIHAQRLNGQPPGLLIFPGNETAWEFYNHVPASINTPFRWEGIPTVFLYSKASIEREGWSNWANDHRSLILEPGDSRTFQTCFAPADRDKFDSLTGTLIASGSPGIKVLPSSVAPVDVGIAVEVAGATPTRFIVSRDADLETDSDEEGGFCFVKPKKPGLLDLTFEDTRGRVSRLHLNFIEPIEELIKKRAEYIFRNQIHDEPGSSLHKAILVYNSKTNRRLKDPEEQAGAFAVEGGLGDALFLAEKNSIYPDIEQIHALDEFICEFLRDDLQNPADESVGSTFADTRSVALNYARPNVYPLVFNFYHSMYRLANVFGETAFKPREYLRYAYGTALAMVRRGIPRQARGAGLPGYARVFDLLADLSAEGMTEEVDRLMPFVSVRAEELLRRPYPYNTDSVWDTSSFEEIFTSARYLNDDEHQERALRFAFASRSLAPSWWWYGSDIRHWDEFSGMPLPALADKGEMCLGYTTAENSLMFFETLDRDYGHLPEVYMRLAFGGMLGVWALVQPDGSASMAYCPDVASRQFGFSPLTGDLGLALFHYLRGAGAFVLPSQSYGVFTFGCHFETDDTAYIVRPWDGVGRRVIMRQVGAEFELTFGRLREIRLDIRKRWAQLTIENPAEKDIRSELRVRGMWGNQFEIMGERVDAVEGELAVSLPLRGQGVSRVDVKVV